MSAANVAVLLGLLHEYEGDEPGPMGFSEERAALRAAIEALGGFGYVVGRVTENGLDVFEVKTTSGMTARFVRLSDSRSVVVDEAMVERALEAMGGRMIDSRRYWTAEERETVRAALTAALRKPGEA